MRYAPHDMDWGPLQAVLDEETLGDWMWMYAAPAADGTLVQFYKHVWTRRYLRLDAAGRVYLEEADGTPRALPGCGGATLLLALVATTAVCDTSVGASVTVPEGAREPTRVDDLPALLALLGAIIADVGEIADAVEPTRAAP